MNIYRISDNYRQSIGIPCISITILSGTHATTADFGWEALEIEIVTKENLKLSLCGLHWTDKGKKSIIFKAPRDTARSVIAKRFEYEKIY